MIKTIVSIEVDLAASRAIRFACQLGNFIPMEIHPVYIKEAPPRNLTIGSGWARRHWESELVQEGKQEISELITSEIEYCPVLRSPRVVYGDRDSEILKILKKILLICMSRGLIFPGTPRPYIRESIPACSREPRCP